MNADLFTRDFKPAPYWWELLAPSEDLRDPLPSKADVVVIGAGYSGLNAALEIARSGRKTVVIDSRAAGSGASSRNGGQVSTSIKPSFTELRTRYGEKRAFEILREGHESLAWLKGFVDREGIDCDLREAGRFHGAHNPKQYELLARRIENEPKGLETEAFLISRSEQRAEVGTDAYFGGAVFPRHASVNPAKLHGGLLNRARAAGAEVISHSQALSVRPERDGFRIQTVRGQIQARNVAVATNGYTDGIAPWLRRRVIPIGSYIIATEAIPGEVMERLMPKDRTIGDTRRVVYYYRASPDRTRILFGGRVSLNETDPRRSAPKLHAELSRLFPELRATRITHSWMGFVGYTFDKLPHLGRHEGIHYVMGYCGSGVAMAGYLGMRLGRQILGLESGATAFDDLAFNTRPYYLGKPWFLAPAVSYFRQMDRLNR